MSVGLSRWIAWPLGLLIAVLLAGRFSALGSTPNGFYLDEAAIATQVLCVAETHADSYGRSWPLYSPVLAGGQVSAPLLYPAALWTKLAGGSEAALRAYSGLAGLTLALAVALAVGLTARSVAAGALSLLLALSSPWLFALSRVFWDPIVGASWIAIALCAYWLARQPERPALHRALLWALAGIAGAAAAYAYPPVRIQLVLSGLIIMLFDRSWLRDPLSLIGLGVLSLLLTPLATLYFDDSGFGARGAMLAIWNADWLRGQNATLWDVPAIGLKKLLAHLDPQYLLWRGDGNLRHSSGYGGLVGPLESMVLLLAVVLAPRFVFSRDGLLLLALFIAALLPAALTWESSPHALRSLGAVGPLLLFLGLALVQVLQNCDTHRQSTILVTLLAGAAIWGACYGMDYFRGFHERSRPWFHDANAPDRLDPSMALAASYYLSRLGQPLNCPGPR